VDQIHCKEQPNGISVGFIITGRRHSDCYQVIHSLLNGHKLKEEVEQVQKLARNENQGFITSHNRYVDRSEAYNIAVANNQCWHTINSDSKILASEDLYYP